MSIIFVVVGTSSHLLQVSVKRAHVHKMQAKNWHTPVLQSYYCICWVLRNKFAGFKCRSGSLFTGQWTIITTGQKEGWKIPNFEFITHYRSEKASSSIKYECFIKHEENLLKSSRFGALIILQRFQCFTNVMNRFFVMLCNLNCNWSSRQYYIRFLLFLFVDDRIDQPVK